LSCLKTHITVCSIALYSIASHYLLVHSIASMALDTVSMGSLQDEAEIATISASAFVRTSLQPTFRNSLSLHSLTHYTIMSATRGKVSSVGVWL
jgi:hypothetical protein